MSSLEITGFYLYLKQKRTISYQTLTKYISSIRSYASSYDHEFTIPPMALKIAKDWRRDERKERGFTTPTRKDKLTYENLREIEKIPLSRVPPNLRPMHETLIALSWFGIFSLSRLGELTTNQPTVVQLVEDETNTTLIVDKSKTDVHRDGTPLSIPTDIWREKVKDRLFLHKLSNHDYIFKVPGHHYDKRKYIEWLQTVMRMIGAKEENGFAGHSLRRGGAQHLFDLGNNLEFIKVKGRWRSDAFRAYIDMSRRPLKYRK